MMKPRFTIRTVLIATFVVAVACCFAPTHYRRMKFADQYNGLNEKEWRRSQGTADGYEFLAPNGAMLSAWTTEHEFVTGSGLVEPKNYSPDATRFFVVPPGKWVNTVDEILETWDHYD